MTHLDQIVLCSGLFFKFLVKLASGVKIQVRNELFGWETLSCGAPVDSLDPPRS